MPVLDTGIQGQPASHIERKLRRIASLLAVAYYAGLRPRTCGRDSRHMVRMLLK